MSRKLGVILLSISKPLRTTTKYPKGKYISATAVAGDYPGNSVEAKGI